MGDDGPLIIDQTGLLVDMLMLRAYKDRQIDNYKGKTKAHNAPL